MTLFIDVENKKLVQSLTSDRSVPAPVFMQGDNEPLEIFLLQKGGESLYEVKPLVVGTDYFDFKILQCKNVVPLDILILELGDTMCWWRKYWQ